MSADPLPSPSRSLAGVRLHFPPSYILVGVYRLSTDVSIRVPVWKKCKHGFVRGALVGLAWVSATDGRQRWTPQPTPFPCRFVSPGVLHVWNSEEPHPTLPVKVRSVPMTNRGLNSHPHARSARITGLSDHSFFGYTVPFELTTRMRLLPYTILILTLPFIHPPSRCPPGSRRSSEFHPQLLSSQEYSHCQATGMGADRRLAW